ncbi:helix-turn-helix domain-containing protein [Kibdelosporangium aridum]|uniref:AraC-type DNA-binding protein n=1 Tax=Kibdelosporangium aridum TaxID=2030 RepID=A0A1W2AW69_KIBAR|nr:AraC family transcriptional regulator [Kibdelosporangium aridum]SMC64722.1 AraC-type DNA-binding protein [Kibdelosporangium aridum]
MSVEVLAGLRRSNVMQWEPGWYRPAEWLSPYVLGYVIEDTPSGPDLRIRCIPNGVVVMTLDLFSPPRRSLAGANADVSPSPVVGMHGGVYVLDTAGSRRSASALLTPWGAHTLFGLGMHELTDHIVSVTDLVGQEGRQLAERLAEQSSVPARLAMLDETLSRWFDTRREPSSTVVWAWRRLEQRAGKISIDALAREVGWSRRLLQARFRDQIGLSPKKVARILRFHRAATALITGQPRLSELAVECGYWDQAHLNLEFRNMCGHTPLDFVRAVRGGRAYPQRE